MKHTDNTENIGEPYLHDDGYAYYFGFTIYHPVTVVLFASPYSKDDVIEYESELMVEDFAEPLSKNKLAFIVHAIYKAQNIE